MALTLKQAQALHSAYINRQYEYRKKSDPLMIKFQLGQITKEQWEAERQKVKDKYPYPEGVDKTEALNYVKEDTGWEFE